MDKNYWIALLLSMLILVGYPYVLRKLGMWQSPQQAKQQTEATAPHQETASPVEIVAKAGSQIVPALETSIQNPAPPSILSANNGIFEMDFSTLGATVTRLKFLGEHDKPEQTHTTFYEGELTRPGLFAIRLSKEAVDLSHSVFKSTQQSGGYEFLFEKPGHYRVTKKYTLDPQMPVIYLDITLENLAAITQNFPVELEYGLHFEAADHNVRAAAMSEKMHDADPNKVRKKGFSVSEKLLWAGVQKKYFAILAKPDWQATGAVARVEESDLWGAIRTEPLSIEPGQKTTRRILIYAGPQKYEYLKEHGFEAIFNQGFFGMFKIWLLIALKFFYGFVHNYGWAVILLTCVIKLVFTPLTHMSYQSMKKMQAIQPKLKSIQERYKNEPAKLNKEMMELYKRNKVNPMGGCLPMLLQIPIFIAFYNVLNEAIELKGAHFAFWINDLAQPDHLFTLPFSIPFLGDAFNLLPLFMIGSMIWQQKLMPQTATSPEQEKIMQYMPVIFGFMFYQMPSGLVLYWFVNNMLTILHQTFIKRMVIVLHHEDRD